MKDAHVYATWREVRQANGHGGAVIVAADDREDTISALRGYEFRFVYLHTYVSRGLEAFLQARIKAPDGRLVLPGDDGYFNPAS